MIDQTLSSIVGQSEPIQRLRTLITRVAPSRLSVLIEGETGVGKELVAQALHALSGRRGPFVAVNACAIAESMFEDTLFGHVRGAFTGAVSDRRGLLAEAHEGTLFLDEIGDLPLSAQAKLLRALETRQFRPVGARSDEASDFRLVAAVNQPLSALVTAGRFRHDLAHRLRAVSLDVPPLRDRATDIVMLAEHFASLAPSASGTVKSPARVVFSGRSLRRLREHQWPGNVRELRHVVERILLFSDSAAITDSDIAQALGDGTIAISGGTSSTNVDKDSFERRRLVEVLSRHQWDTSSAASELGVTRKNVYQRLRRLKIELPEKYRRRVADRSLNASPRLPRIHQDSPVNLEDSPVNLGESSI